MAKAAAPPITKMLMATVRKMEGVMVVGRRFEMDALWCTEVKSNCGFDAVDN